MFSSGWRFCKNEENVLFFYKILFYSYMKTKFTFETKHQNRYNLFQYEKYAFNKLFEQMGIV